MLVADVSYGLEIAEERLLFWLTFLTMATGRQGKGNAIDVLLVASHTDKSTDDTQHELGGLPKRLQQRFSKHILCIHPQVFTPRYHEPHGGDSLDALCEQLETLAGDDARKTPFPEM